jgi:soluble lytic murein transglycosylase
MKACGGLAVVLGFVTLCSTAAAQPTETEARDAALRKQFVAAYEAANAGIVAGDDAALRGYALYPYLQAARLERALARAEGPWHETDAATEAFLAEAGRAPVAQALRRAWLASLARRASWAAFIAQFDAATATATLECQYFNARIAEQDTAGLAEAIRVRWLTASRLPSECERAFQWLRAERGLPDALVAQRVALLLDAGNAAFARVIAARLPKDTAAPLLERAAFIENPSRMLDALVGDPSRAVPAGTVLEAWSRLTRAAPDAALARLTALRERMAASEQAHELARALALGLAWDRRPEALDHFASVPRSLLDDLDLEWWARAAMWAGDWDVVRTAIAAMSTEHRAESAWRYWAARAAEESGEGAAANALYSALRGDDNYYSAMAAAHLGERVTPQLESIPFDADQVATIAATETFRRVRELTLVGLRELATMEWRYGYASLPEQQRFQAVQLAARWEIYDIAVATATSHRLFNDYTLLYPKPFADDVAAAVKLTNVEPHLLYGVLRQESLFRADAASSGGALGVAQLTPQTARETARRWKLPAPTRADLFDPRINITLGAARFAELLEQFDEQLPVALGAYNAGAGAAARWLPQRSTDSDVWIENIPYNETRAYVRRVLWHSVVFAWLETRRPQSTVDWLRQIDTRAQTASANEP